MTLTPAYGRDYKSKKEVLEAFLANKDFMDRPPFPARDLPINRPQIEESGIREVGIRYKRERSKVRLRREGDTWVAL